MSCRIEYNSSGPCVILANVTCIRFQKCTTLATGSVAMEHPGPKRATKVRCSVRCSIKALIAYASEHYKGSRKKSIECDKNIHNAHKHFIKHSDSVICVQDGGELRDESTAGLANTHLLNAKTSAAGSHVMES